MTYSDWEEKYKPIENPFSSGGGDIIFEGDERDGNFLSKQNPLCVWTDVEYDGCNFVWSGVHIFNRVCYYVTEIPREEGEEIQALIAYDDDPPDTYKEGDWRD